MQVEADDWEEFIETIDELLDDYAWAEDTLMGIREWVVEHEHVTDKQRQAVKNIIRAVDR